MLSTAYGPEISVNDASQVLVCGAAGTSSMSVATHSGRASEPRGYVPPSSTPTICRVGGVLGTAVTLALNRAFCRLKPPLVVLPPVATVVVTVADPTPTGVTVTSWAPRLPQADSTRLDGETVATVGSLEVRFTVTTSLAASKLQPGSLSSSPPTT